MRRKIALPAAGRPLVEELCASGALWVRLAPVNVQRGWRVDPGYLRTRQAAMAGSFATGVTSRLPGSMLPRSKFLAILESKSRRPSRGRGASPVLVDEGRITYETRSRLWGFPDYTGIAVTEDLGGAAPVVLARARYGALELLHVNRARVNH